MSEEDVQNNIKTESVREAFKFSKIESLPPREKALYAKDEQAYDKYSEHTAKQVEKGRKAGEEKAKIDIARKMILKGKTNAEILDVIEEFTEERLNALRAEIAKSQKQEIVMEMTFHVLVIHLLNL